MGRGGTGEKNGLNDAKETDPAIPKPAEGGDQISKVIGEVGRWQLEKILIVFVAAAPGLAHIFHAGFITPKQKFWCERAEFTNGTEIEPPWFIKYEYEKKNTTYEVYPNKSSEWFVKYDYSEKYEDTDKNITSEMYYNKKILGHCVKGCMNYEFDHDFWVSTMITEWDLVCEKSWLKTLAKLLLFTGFALGSFCSGLVSDRYGRKIAIWVCSVTMMVFGVITSFAPWYPLFVICWWITGTMAIACYTAAFVWTMEIAAGKWKIWLGMSMNYSWPVCRLIIAGLAWGLRDWHWHLRCISALVAVGAVLLFWLPESPRWLIARSRMDEAKKILSDASKKNGKPVEPEQIVLTRPSVTASKGGFLDIMRHPTLRRHVLIMYFNWFTTAFIMYGLALSWQNLTGELFVNFIIGTILDFPAKTLAMVMVQKVGRKYPYMVGSTTTGVMFLLQLFIKRDYYTYNWPIVTLALIGNFSTTMCFAILYMYTGELMPTTVRAAGVGSSSLVSKIGGTLSTTVAALADIHPAIPTCIFAVMALISGSITFFVPETMGRKMPETIDDIEIEPLFGKRSANKGKAEEKPWMMTQEKKGLGLHVSPSAVSLG